MPPTPPAVHCVLCRRCTVENSPEHGRNARHFSDTAFSSAVYRAAGTQEKTVVYIDGILDNFSMHLSGSLGTLPPFCDEQMRSAWAELSPILFCDHFWIAFAIPPHTEMTWSIAMISHPKGFILTSFWGHFRAQNGLVDPFPAPGINLEARKPSRPKFHHFSQPCFETLFGPVLVSGWTYVENLSQIPVFVPSLISERCLIDFEVTFGGQIWSQV